MLNTLGVKFVTHSRGGSWKGSLLLAEQGGVHGKWASGDADSLRAPTVGGGLLLFTEKVDSRKPVFSKAKPYLIGPDLSTVSRPNKRGGQHDM